MILPDLAMVVSGKTVYFTVPRKTVRCHLEVRRTLGVNNISEQFC